MSCFCISYSQTSKCAANICSINQPGEECRVNDYVLLRRNRTGNGFSGGRCGRGISWILMKLLRIETEKDVNPDANHIDQQMMIRAMELARMAAKKGEVPVGAVVYRGTEIIAEGFNLRECAADPTAHAEIIAIRRAANALCEWRLNDCSLAVTLEPCPMCAGAIVNARLGRLIYGATDPKAGAVKTLYRLCNDQRLNHRVQVIGGIMARDCGQLLKDFFRKKREANKQEKRKAG